MRPVAARPLTALALAAAAVVASTCDREREHYRPGLGEIMTFTQMRHAKLWFAGAATNWDLASYETDELEEGFADAMEYHKHHESSPVPLTEAIPRFTASPLAGLRAAIAARDPSRFAAAFDSLTAGCNGCHLATRLPCNVVVRPQTNNFTNQDFSARDH